MPSRAEGVVVLVVDDEADVRFLIGVSLDSAGFRVVEATNGQHARRMLETHKPHAMVTDLMMPVMGGRELIALTRADPTTADLPILVVSASITGEPTGADACLAKPFKLSDLIAAVERLVGDDT